VVKIQHLNLLMRVAVQSPLFLPVHRLMQRFDKLALFKVVFWHLLKKEDNEQTL
jgi:hypothetical protein